MSRRYRICIILHLIYATSILVYCFRSGGGGGGGSSSNGGGAAAGVIVIVTFVCKSNIF